MRQAPALIRVYSEPITATPVTPASSGQPPAGTLSFYDFGSSWGVQDHNVLPGDTYDLLPFDIADYSSTFDNWFSPITVEPTGVHGDTSFLTNTFYGWECISSCWAQISYTMNWDPSSADDGVYQSAILLRSDGDTDFLYTGFLNYGAHDWHAVNAPMAPDFGGIYGITHNNSIVIPITAGTIIGLGAKWFSEALSGNDAWLYVPTIRDTDRAFTLSLIVLEEIVDGGNN